MKEYEFIEHTADIGVKAFGNNISECFEHAAKGMFDIITDSSHIDIKGVYVIDLEFDDLEQVLVDWLSELLFLHSSRNIVFSKFKVNIDLNKNKLSSTVYGELFDTDKHKTGVEIKAVTYHMVKVNTEDPYFVQVLFDI